MFILNSERMSVENGNCSSVYPLSHWSKKLINQVREPLLMRESDFFCQLNEYKRKFLS